MLPTGGRAEQTVNRQARFKTPEINHLYCKLIKQHLCCAFSRLRIAFQRRQEIFYDYLAPVLRQAPISLGKEPAEEVADSLRKQPHYPHSQHPELSAIKGRRRRQAFLGHVSIPRRSNTRNTSC